MRNPDLRLTSVVSSDVHRAVQTAQLAFVRLQNHLQDPNGVPPNEYGIEAFAGLNECEPYVSSRVLDYPKDFTRRKKLVMVNSRNS